MAFIDCNEQKTANKSAWPERPHCEHGPWFSNGRAVWKSPKASRKYHKKDYHRVKGLALAMLGGVCANCGTDSALEFDHIDPATKEFDVSHLFDRGWTETLRAELVKCQLLCAYCHKAKTAQERRQNATAKQDQLDALLNLYGSEAA